MTGRRQRADSTAEVNARRVMLLDRLVYRDGWPRVERAPSSPPLPRPATR